MTTLDSIWWDQRTLASDGSVDLTPWDWETACWIRYRLADEINRRYYVSHGIRVLYVNFEPMDGDQYSHPIVRMGCRQPKVSVARLSSARVALDSLPYGNEFPWAGLVEEDSSWDYEDRSFANWQTFVNAAIEAIGLDRLSSEGHEGCPHRRPDSRVPDMQLLAILVRTHLGTKIQDRWMAERVIEYIGGLGRTLDMLKGHPANMGVPLDEGDWLAVVDGPEDNQALALRYDGRVLTPTGLIDAGRQIDVGLPLIEIAGSLDASLALGH